MSRAHSDSESFADDENSSLESETEPDKIALQLAPILTVHSDTHISSDDDRPIPVLTPQRRSPIPQRDSPVPHRNSPVPAIVFKCIFIVVTIFLLTKTIRLSNYLAFQSFYVELPDEDL